MRIDIGIELDDKAIRRLIQKKIEELITVDASVGVLLIQVRDKGNRNAVWKDAEIKASFRKKDVHDS